MLSYFCKKNIDILLKFCYHYFVRYGRYDRYEKIKQNQQISMGGGTLILISELDNRKKINTGRNSNIVTNFSRVF